MTKVSSAEVASDAGQIMAQARRGGPVMRLLADLQGRYDGIDAELKALYTVIDRQLRPYIDAAERVAASVLSQRE